MPDSQLITFTGEVQTDKKFYLNGLDNLFLEWCNISAVSLEKGVNSLASDKMS